MRDLEQLEYEDALVALNSAVISYGARKVFQDFRDAFPEIYQEIVIQINRLPPQSQVAALLR